MYPQSPFQVPSLHTCLHDFNHLDNFIKYISDVIKINSGSFWSRYDAILSDTGPQPPMTLLSKGQFWMFCFHCQISYDDTDYECLQWVLPSLLLSFSATGTGVVVSCSILSSVHALYNYRYIIRTQCYTMRIDVKKSRQFLITSHVLRFCWNFTCPISFCSNHQDNAESWFFFKT